VEILHHENSKEKEGSYLDDACQFGAESRLPMKQNSYSFKNMFPVSLMNCRPNPGPLHVISIWKNHVSNKMKSESLNIGEGFEGNMEY